MNTDPRVFAQQLDAYGARTQARLERIGQRAAELAEESVKFGSPVTRSKGVPVRTGRLKRSIVTERVGNKFKVLSRLRYAWVLEHRKQKTRWRFGARGFFRLTRRGTRKLVTIAVNEVMGGQIPLTAPKRPRAAR